MNRLSLYKERMTPIGPIEPFEPLRYRSLFPLLERIEVGKWRPRSQSDECARGLKTLRLLLRHGKVRNILGSNSTKGCDVVQQVRKDSWTVAGLDSSQAKGEIQEEATAKWAE